MNIYTAPKKLDTIGGIFMARKVKYDVAFKLKCVKEFKENNQSIMLISRHENISESLLRKWIGDYEFNGIVGLFPKTNQVYSIEFKLNVIEDIKRNHLSLREARKKFNIPSNSIIIKWQKDFAIFGLDGLYPKPKGRPKIMNRPKRKTNQAQPLLTREEELLLENERLRCEVALLKKFNALIQAEEEKAKKLGRKP